MSKYAEEMIINYGTIGRLRKLTTHKKEQEKISRELKQAEENIRKIFTKKKE